MTLDDRIASAVEGVQGVVTDGPGPSGIIRRQTRRRRINLALASVSCVGILTLVGATMVQRDPSSTTVSAGRGDGAEVSHTMPSLPPPVDGRCRAPAAPTTDEATTTISVYFFCEGDQPPAEPVAIPRRVPKTSEPLRSALEQLLEGPTEEEARLGFSSPFGAPTAGLLDNVTTTSNGTAVVSFRKEFTSVPGFGTMYTGYFVGRSLQNTIFQFPPVKRILWEIDGSREAWCHWSEGDICEPTTRPPHDG